MKKTMKAVAALMLMMTVVFAAGCKKNDGPNNGGDNNEVNLNGTGTYSGHDYVDLGLPSGTLWATCNVGATMPEGYGDYFAWGETQSKDTYDWTTYKYCEGAWDGCSLTKYCNNFHYGYNGFTDDLTTLQPSDDAALASWGGNWRMPTKDEFEELYNNTTVIWSTQNGVNGRLFTASNGNGLFLPATGNRRGGELHDDGIFGYYWSSFVSTADSRSAWYLMFNSGYIYMNDTYMRKFGLSVRPVRSAN